MFTHLDTIQYPELKSIEIPPMGRFYTTPGGKRYPSITTVLGSIEKPGITEWKKSMGEKNAKKETERCATRGTNVHTMMERYLNNEPDPTNGFTFEHITSFNNLKMYATRINNILGQEVALYSDQLKVAGRCDVIAEYQGVLSVIDFKTSTNSKDVALIEDYFLQCTAYALMFLEMFDINIDQIVVMIAVEKGIPLIYKRNIDDYISPLFKRIKQYHSKNNK